ncbi:hypothetical protein CAEBREN_25296 [Caenorhabditis brenneri]|uniref:Uncharacterized protein n=1 Tax=Caenorhabditis brenneri TaxID=135651 RepID=G0PL88_CAEBE|nr:hypothetical protein CAEBREN_25296 [Caenorhabditis brenneri]
MQRYNPPSTSAQSVCIGCIRQIRKVNQVLQEQYKERINHDCECQNYMMRIRELERALEMERAQKRTLKVMFSTRNPEEPDEKLKEVLEINKKLISELQKVKEVSVTLPFEQWKDGIETSWSEKYEDLKEFACDRQEQYEYYKKKYENQREITARYKQAVIERNQEIDDLRTELELHRDMESEEEEEEMVEMKDDGEVEPPSCSSSGNSTSV